MEFPSMTIPEMLEWSDDIRGTLNHAKGIASGLQLSAKDKASIEVAFAKEEKRAHWLDQMVLARLELEEEDANG